jgi:hypothetical protein
MIVQGTSPSKAVASPEVYISYTLLSLKQQKRIFTKATKRLTCKSTTQGVTAKRKKRKFTFQLESGESSCQPRHRATRRFKERSSDGVSIRAAPAEKEAKGGKRHVHEKPR